MPKRHEIMPARPVPSPDLGATRPWNEVDGRNPVNIIADELMKEQAINHAVNPSRLINTQSAMPEMLSSGAGATRAMDNTNHTTQNGIAQDYDNTARKIPTWSPKGTPTDPGNKQ